jgi:hypothetical protein
MNAIFQITDLKIIGFADALSEVIHPRILPPIFQQRSGTAVLFPPFIIINGRVLDAYAETHEVFEQRVNAECATKFSGDAIIDNHLWVDDTNTVRYQPRYEIQKAFDSIFDYHLNAANEAWKKRDLEVSYLHAAIAHAVKPEHIEPLVLRGAVEWERLESDALDYTQELAGDQMGSVEFKELILLKRGVQLRPAPSDVILLQSKRFDEALKQLRALVAPFTPSPLSYAP